jgi:hypothetical protein
MSRTVKYILLGAASGILAGLALSGRRQPAGGKPAVRAMSTSVRDETTASGIHATTRPYSAGGLAVLSACAAVIHFAVTFEHFNEYLWYGVFFLVIAWAQLIWAAVAVWRLPRWWLWLGIAGNAAVLAVYLASRTTGLPFGPDKGHTEPFGGLDVVSALLELALIAGCAALLWRPSLAGRPVRRRTGFAAIASMAAVPAGVIAATTAVMLPGWAGPEGPAGMAPGMTPSPATAAQVIATGQVIKQTGTSLARFRPETAGHWRVT